MASDIKSRNPDKQVLIELSYINLCQTDPVLVCVIPYRRCSKGFIALFLLTKISPSGDGCGVRFVLFKHRFSLKHFLNNCGHISFNYIVERCKYILKKTLFITTFIIFKHPTTKRLKY